MRTLWRWLGITLLAVAGCRAGPPNLEPPPQPDCFDTPPANDSRYNKPYTPPRDPTSSVPVPRMSNPIVPTRSPRAGMGQGGF